MHGIQTGAWSELCFRISKLKSPHIKIVLDTDNSEILTSSECYRVSMHGWSSSSVFWPSTVLTWWVQWPCLRCPWKDTLVLGTGRVHPCCHHFEREVIAVPMKLGMARHTLACSCPSVCPRLKCQTVIHVYIPDEIHALGFHSSKQKPRGMNTTSAYSAKVLNSPFGKICTTPSVTVTSTCGVFVTGESLLVSRHPTRSDIPLCFSFQDEDSAGGYFWLSR